MRAGQSALLDTYFDQGCRPQLKVDPVDPEDSLASRVLEAAENGQSVLPILTEFTESKRIEWQCDALTAAFSLIDGVQKKDKGLAVDQLRWAIGLSASLGEDGVRLALRHHITKQAFQQGANRMASKLGIGHPPPLTPRPASYARHCGFSVFSWTGQFRRWLRLRPPAKWTPQKRQAVRFALKPIVELYQRLA